MTGSAIIDLPTLFIGVLALLVVWDATRGLVAFALQVVSFAWMWRIRAAYSTPSEDGDSNRSETETSASS